MKRNSYYFTQDYKFECFRIIRHLLSLNLPLYISAVSVLVQIPCTRLRKRMVVASTDNSNE